MINTYTYDEVYSSTLEYFNGDALSTSVWINKYCLKNDKNEFFELNPNDMHHRLAKEFARIESKYENPLSEETIFYLLKDFKYIIPQGSPMAGIGNELQVTSLGNCFVLGNDYDSYSGIIQAEEEMIQAMKRRGGVGLDLSHLRPKGTPVNNAAITSTGIVPFMERYSNGTREVAQDGRRGALLLSLDCTHPDAEDFIDAKLSLNKVTGANISIKVTNKFMKAVEQGEKFIQQFPVDSPNPIVTKEIDALKLWKKIVHNAWRSAEPGLLFIDTALRESPADCYVDEGFKTLSTNPCVSGETAVEIQYLRQGQVLHQKIRVRELVELRKNYPEIFIKSFDINSQQIEYELLVNCQLTKSAAQVVALKNNNTNQLLILTPDHKVYTRNRHYISAEALAETDKIQTVEGPQQNFYIEPREELIDVYDLTVNKNHNFFAEDILVRNCGEIFLSNGDSCRLLVLNLYSFVDDPFTENAEFNFTKFTNYVNYAQRLMDDLVDLEEEKLNKILEKLDQDPESITVKQTEINLWKKIKSSLVKGRRTGLGITAEGDMLAALNLQYGTSEATTFSTEVHRCLASNSYKASIEMAKERGAFPVWNYSKEQGHPFIERILDSIVEYYPNQGILEDYKTFGRRNIANNTVSPSGSISLLTQTSSGLEPVFSLFHTRRRKINPNDKHTKTDYVDLLGDHWEEYHVIHPKFQTWATLHGYDHLAKLPKHKLEDLVKLSPYYKATANEIDWVEKVRLQAGLQKYTDHSLSNTTNLPELVTEETISEIYFTAWKLGCKGITIYRDKSRSGVLVDEKENKVNIFQENHAPKRPKNLPCDIIRFSAKGDKWIGFLGLLENKPYEVFTGPQEQVPIPAYLTSAEIVKEKSPDGTNIYNLRYVDKDGFVQEFKGLSRAFNKEFWNIGRMTSAILRHGMPLFNVMSLIDRLEIDGGEHISNWKNGVKRMLKKYLKEGTMVKGEICHECKSTNIVYKEGCLQCQDCGWSKCG